MDFRNFTPLMNIFRQDRREDPLDEFPNQYFLGSSMFPGRFDNVQRNLPIRLRRNGIQDYDQSIIRARGRPIEAVPVRSAEGTPRFRLIDQRGGFYGSQPVRSPRARIVDVMEDERAARPGIIRGRGDRSIVDADPESLDIFDHYFPLAGPEQKRPETRPTDLQSQRPAPMTLPNSSAQEYQLGNTIRPQSTGGLQGSQLRSGPLKEGLPFCKAMKWLHEETDVALAFYDEFETEFGNEVGGISYVNKEMKEKLWTMKLAGKRSDHTQDMADKPVGKWGKLFSEQERLLCVAMEAVLNATLSLRDKKPPKPVALEAMKRLQQKVATASRQIVDLLNSATADREHCKALLGELEFLKGLVDPEKEENKEMLAEGGGDSDDGEDNGSTNNGGDQAEQQAESWDGQLL